MKASGQSHWQLTKVPPFRQLIVSQSSEFESESEEQPKHVQIRIEKNSNLKTWFLIINYITITQFQSEIIKNKKRGTAAYCSKGTGIPVHK